MNNVAMSNDVVIQKIKMSSGIMVDIMILNDVSKCLVDENGCGYREFRGLEKNLWSFEGILDFLRGKIE